MCVCVSVFERALEGGDSMSELFDLIKQLPSNKWPPSEEEDLECLFSCRRRGKHLRPEYQFNIYSFTQAASFKPL